LNTIILHEPPERNNPFPSQVFIGHRRSDILGTIDACPSEASLSPDISYQNRFKRDAKNMTGKMQTHQQHEPYVERVSINHFSMM